MEDNESEFVREHSLDNSRQRNLELQSADVLTAKITELEVQNSDLRVTNINLRSRIDAQGRLITSTKASCDDAIHRARAQFETVENMLKIAFESKDQELRRAKIELEQTRGHMFSIHMQMTTYQFFASWLSRSG